MQKDEQEYFSPQRQQIIACLAEEVADEFSPKGKVNPLEIIENNCITTSFNNYAGAFDGMLEHRSSKFHIYVNLDRVGQKDSTRAIFTLGHELGHYYIDEHRYALASGRVESHRSVCEYGSKLLVELEADHFASHLLMPTQRFKKAAAKLSKGLDAIRELSVLFGTSILSSALRYLKVEIIPCALFKWSSSGNLEWKMFSSSTYQAGFHTIVALPKALAIDSATARVLKGESSANSATIASSWFLAVSKLLQDVIFIEQAISLGRFGAVTLLYPEKLKYDSFLNSTHFVF